MRSRLVVGLILDLGASNIMMHLKRSSVTGLGIDTTREIDNKRRTSTQESCPFMTKSWTLHATRRHKVLVSHKECAHELAPFLHGPPLE